jgi:hypothetical protein
MKNTVAIELTAEELKMIRQALFNMAFDHEEHHRFGEGLKFEDLANKLLAS